MQTVRRALNSVVDSPVSPARRRLAALAMAVALAAPVYSVSVTLAQSADRPVLLAIADDPAAALTASQDLIKAGKYEEALTALQSIKADALPDEQKAALAAATKQAQDATQMRRAARADFEMGQKALDTGDNVTAQNSFKNVLNNPYADEGTKAKAQEQSVLAAAGAKGADTDWKAMYDDAVGDYKAGNYAAAKPKFVALQNGGYKPGLFNKAPREYVELIDKNAAGPGTEAQARAAYLTARDQYKKGDWIAARQNFNKAQSMGYKAGFFEDEPGKYLARMDKKEQADAAMAAKAEMNSRPSNAAVVAMADAPPAVAPPDTTAAPGGVAAPGGSTAAATPAAAPDVTTAPAGSAAAAPAPAPAAPSDDQSKLAANVRQLEAEKANKQYQATQLTQSAKAAEDGQRYQEAKDLYTKAYDLDPANAQARAGRDRMLVNTGVSPVAEDPGERLSNKINAQRQSINFSFNNALTQAREQTDRGEFDSAATSIALAEAATRSDRGLFNNNELQAFDTQLADARTGRERAIVAKRERDTAVARQGAENDAEQRRRQEDENKSHSISALITESRRLSELNRYGEALKVVNQILVLDPRNEYAIGVKAILFDRASLQQQRKDREEYDRNRVLQLDAVRGKEIPFADILTYPPDWPDLSARRDKTLQEERQVSAADESVNALLDKTLPEIRFDQVAFSDVIDFLRDTTQANLFVNWKALEQAGIDRNTPVSIRLRSVKLSKVLRTILDNVGGGATVTLGYTVDEGVITISTSEDLAKNTETRTYDIRDLILQIPNYTDAPNLSLENSSSSGTRTAGGGGGGGGGGNQNLFGGGGGGGGGNGSGQANETTQTREELVDSITNLIRETVGPGTWKEDGGAQGSLRELGGQLIVSQTPEVHRSITGLLSKLREQRSIQIQVETRFLTVQKNFLEDVGIDFDFYFNFDGNPFAGVVPGGTIPAGITAAGNGTAVGSGASGNIVSGGAAAGIDPTTGLPTAATAGRVRTGVAPIGVVQNSIAFTQPSSLNTGVTGNLGDAFATPALATQINAFLDDFQASLFFRATQGNQNVTQMTAPRLTLFNGQQAWIAVTTDINYVSDLDPVVGQSAVAFGPTVATLQTGVVLSVQATVSADRKYVTLNIVPTLSRLLGIDSFPVTASTTNNTIATVIDPTTGQVIPNQPTNTTSVGYLQQPRVQRTILKTSVSIPDGGTLLLGGTTVSGEIEREAGVPVLSKIPFLKRAFTNRSSARDESVLLILVKPTIIIQREIEQQSFPLLSNRPG